MSDGLNKVFLLGNLGADPELRQTSGGQSVLKLRIATSQSFLDGNNQRQERTSWHNVVIWGKRAEALSRFLSKGSRLHIEGELRYSDYVGKEDGIKRYQTDIVARQIILLGTKTAESRRGDAAEPENHYQNDGGDDDIPF